MLKLRPINSNETELTINGKTSMFSYHNPPPKYVMSEIPNNPEGLEEIRIIKKYLNRDRYRLVVRGQHLKAGRNWRHFTYSQPIPDSTHLRVYLYDRKKWEY